MPLAGIGARPRRQTWMWNQEAAWSHRCAVAQMRDPIAHRGDGCVHVCAARLLHAEVGFKGLDLGVQIVQRVVALTVRQFRSHSLPHASKLFDMAHRVLHSSNLSLDVGQHSEVGAFSNTSRQRDVGGRREPINGGRRVG